MIGESFAALGNQFESLFQTIFGRDFDLAILFEAATNVLNVFINAIHDLRRIVENVIIAFQAVGTVIHAAFTGDWASVAGQGLKCVSEELYAARDAATATALQMDILYAKAAKSLDEIGSQTEVWNVLGRNATPSGVIAGNNFGAGVGKGLKVEKNVVAEFYQGLRDEIEKQSARLRLESLGASEGLINAILGSGEGWQKVFDKVLKQGVASLKQAQKLFNQTGAGIKEIEAQAQKLREAEIERAKQMSKAEPDMKEYWEAYIGYLEEGIEKQKALEMAQASFDNLMAEAAAKRAAENRKLREEFRKSVQEAFEAFDTAGAVAELGEFQSAARDLREELTDLVDQGLKKDGIGVFSKRQQKQLSEIIDQVGDSLEQIGKARDKIASEISAAQDSLAQQQESKKSLFQSIIDSLFGGVNIAQIGGKSQTIIKSLQRTLQQTTQFSKQLTDLRGLGLSEQLIQQIIGEGAQIGGQTAKALIQGGPKAIEEINKLYDQIGDVAEEIGSDAADAMFDAGIDTTNALIEGLLSQQEQLVAVAEQLADTFESAFSMRLNKRTLPIFFENIRAILDGLGEVPSTATTAASINSASMGRGGSAVYNISINPGLVSDPAGLGREVVTAIQRYENTSGQVFARA
jgi:nucleoid-associated protein YgaU